MIQSVEICEQCEYHYVAQGYHTDVHHICGLNKMEIGTGLKPPYLVVDCPRDSDALVSKDTSVKDRT